MTVRPYLVNGQWRTGEGTFEVKSPFDDAVVAEIAVPTEADVEEATRTAQETFAESKRLSVAARSAALDHVSARLAETIDENAELIAADGGKPLKWARVEAARAVSMSRARPAKSQPSNTGSSPAILLTSLEPKSTMPSLVIRMTWWPLTPITSIGAKVAVTRPPDASGIVFDQNGTSSTDDATVSLLRPTPVTCVFGSSAADTAVAANAAVVATATIPSPIFLICSSPPDVLIDARPAGALPSSCRRLTAPAFLTL